MENEVLWVAENGMSLEVTLARQLGLSGVNNGRDVVREAAVAIGRVDGSMPLQKRCQWSGWREW